MADHKLFHDDPSLSHLVTRIVQSGTEDQKPWVRLEQTIFYPEGGGQPADRGTIDGVPVTDVQSRPEGILHFLERPLDAQTVTAELDARRRFDHCQQHTAQHLLTAWLQDRADLPTTAFHLGETYSAIEVDGPVPDPGRLRRFEDEVNALVREDREVTARWVDPGQMEKLPVRTRGLPEGHRGPVRLVKIQGLDLNTCGGTHVSSLSEIQMIHLTGAESARGGARIHFIAGGRVMDRLRGADELDAELKKRIGTAPDQFPHVIDGWQAEKKTLARRIKILEEQNASHLAATLADRTGDVVTHMLEDAGPDQLRALAREVLSRRPEAVVALVGVTGDPPVACFFVQAGPEGPEDVSQMGTRLRDALGARGGGKGRLFQGRGGPPPQIEREAMRKRLEEAYEGLSRLNRELDEKMGSDGGR